MDHYAYLTRRFRHSGTKIDLGCGHKCRQGYVGIDIRDKGQDLLWDVRQGLPFPDNSIIAVYSSHFIEHLTDSEWRNLIVEIIRVCAPNALIELRCPHLSCVEAYYHGHVSLWSEKRMKGFALGFERGAVTGEKFPRLLSLKVVGIELQADFKILLK